MRRRLAALLLAALVLLCGCQKKADPYADVPNPIATIADEAAIGMVNCKTTAVRVIPAPGTKVGDNVEFGGLLGRAPVIPLREFSAAEFIHRGGRIPAPLHSLKN